MGSGGPIVTGEDIAIGQIMAIRAKQRRNYDLQHDREHEDWEWLGLIAAYAAAGRYTDAAALCVAAFEAHHGEKAGRE